MHCMLGTGLASFSIVAQYDGHVLLWTLYSLALLLNRIRASARTSSWYDRLSVS